MCLLNINAQFKFKNLAHIHRFGSTNKWYQQPLFIMRVAINFCSTTPQKLEMLAWWQAIVNELAVLHPEHQFYFIVNAGNVSSPKKDNLQEIVVKTNPCGHFLKTIYWFGFALPALIKKLKVDVVVHPFGEFMIQKAAKQLMVFNQTSYFNEQYSFIGKKLYFKILTRKLKRDAGFKLFFYSQVEQQAITLQYGWPQENGCIIKASANTQLQPLDFEQKETVKARYSDGCEYFYFSGVPKDGIELLLKAFSLFKKWQKSNMKLLIQINGEKKEQEWVKQKLINYKYRSDVVLLENVLTPTENAILMGAAYSYVYLRVKNQVPIEVLNAFNSGVPVIGTALPAIQEIFGEACLYTQLGDLDSLAEQLKNMYKDERLRTHYADLGLRKSMEFPISNTLDSLWQVILQKKN